MKKEQTSLISVMFTPVQHNTFMDQSLNKMKYFIEQQAFGVCARLGERMNISPSSIRLYFIYTSCLPLGSPVILYLIAAFWLEMRTHIRRNANPTFWEL